MVTASDSRGRETASEKLRALKPEGIVVSDAPYEGYSDRVLLTEAERDALADVLEAAENPLLFRELPIRLADLCDALEER